MLVWNAWLESGVAGHRWSCVLTSAMRCQGVLWPRVPMFGVRSVVDQDDKQRATSPIFVLLTCTQKSYYKRVVGASTVMTD